MGQLKADLNRSELVRASRLSARHFALVGGQLQLQLFARFNYIGLSFSLRAMTLAIIVALLMIKLG